ncbi:fibronectin type III domain-containing protein [Persicobacter diffluens]
MTAFKGRRISHYLSVFAILMAVLVGCVLETPEFLFPKPVFTAVSDSSYFLHVNWDPILGAGAYKVYYEIDDNDQGELADPEVVSINDAGITSVQIDDFQSLVPGRDFKVAVEVLQSTNAALGQSQMSDIANVKIAPLRLAGISDEVHEDGAISRITPLNAENTNSIKFSWPVTKGATHYAIQLFEHAPEAGYQDDYRKDRSPIVSRNQDIPLGENQMQSINDLNPDTEYWVRVYGLYKNEQLIPSDSVRSVDYFQVAANQAIKTNEIYPPNALQVLEEGLDFVQIQWDRDLVNTGYFYFLQISSNGDFSQDDGEYFKEIKINAQQETQPKVQVLVDGLQASKASEARVYYFRVYVENDYTISDFSEVVAAQTLVFPAPINLQHSHTKNTITISWDAVEAATHYDAELRSEDGSIFKQATNIAETTYTFTALPADTEFTFRVKARNNKPNLGYESDFSDPAGAITESVPTPNGFRVSEVFLTKLKLVWDAQSEVDKYRIFYYKEGEAETEAKTKEVLASQNTTLLEGLEPGQEYQIKIVSVFEGVESQASQVLDNPFSTETLNAPTSLLYEVGYDTARLKWNHQFDHVAPVSFEVLFEESSRFDQGEFRTGGSTEAFFTTPNDLVPNSTAYKYTVRAVYDEAGQMYYSDYTALSAEFLTVDLAVPADLSSSEEAIDAFRATWSVVDYQGQGSSGDYIVQYATQADWSDSVNVLVSGATDVLLDNLSKSTTYYYRVKGLFKEYASAWSSTKQAQTLGLHSPDPSTVTVDLTFNSMQLNWGLVADATAYRLAIYEESDYSDEPVVLELSANAYLLQSLQPGTHRYFRLYSRFGNEYSDVPTAFAAQTLFFGQPMPPAVVGNDYTLISLNWPTVSAGEFEAENYTLYWSQTNDLSAAVAIPVYGNNQTITALTPESAYYFWIQAHYQGHSSPISEVREGFTKTLEIPLITGSNSTKPDEIILSWSMVPYSNAYELEYSTDENFNTDVNVLNVSGNNYTFNSLKKNTTYYFRVRGIFEGNRSAYSVVKEQATIDLPTPENLREKAVDFYSMEVEWDAVTPVTSYTLYISGTANNASATPVSIPSGQTRYLISDLSPGTDRFFRIRANHNAETSEVSAEIKLSTLILVEPTGLKLENAQYNAIDASWEAVNLANEYELQWATDNNFSSPKSVTLSASSLAHTITDLDPNQPYFVRFRAKVGGYYSQFSGIEQLNTSALALPVIAAGDNITASGFRANWAASGMGYETEYEIWLGESSTVGGEPTMKVGMSTDYAFSGLDKNKSYYYRVRGWYNAHSSEWSDAEQVTTLELTAPTNLTISNISFNSMDLQWDAVSTANAYELVWADNPSFSDATTSTISSTSFRLTGLKAGTHWYFRLYSLFDTEKSDTYTTADAATLALEKPELLASTDIFYNGFTTHWKQVENATKYTIQYSLQSDFSIVNEVEVTDGNQLSIALTDLKPDSDYYVRMRAWITDHFSAYSDPMVTKTAAIPAPAGLTISNIRQDAFTVSWVASNFEEFEVSISGGVNKTERVGNVFTYEVTNLTKNTDYEVMVTGVYGGDYKVSSLAEPVRTLDLLAPANFQVDAVSFNTIQLSWSAATDAQSYEIQYDTDANFTASPKTEVLSGTTYEMNNLLPGTSYYFRIRSVYNTQQSAYSSPAILGTTLELEKPVLKAASNISFNSAQVNWDLVDNASRYTIEYAEDASFAVTHQLEVNDGAATMAILSGLMPATTYHLRMRAWITDHFSDYSNVVTFNTNPLAAPVITAVHSISQDAFTVDWSGTDFDSYELHISGGKSEVINAGNLTSWTFTDLEKNTVYGLKVVGLYAGTYKVESAVSSTQTLDLLPPTNFAVSSVDFNNINLSWTAATDAQNYEIAYATNTGFTDQKVIADLNGNSYTFNDLLPGTTYHFKIRSAYNNVRSDYSSAISGGTDDLATPVLTNLKDFTHHTITADWNVVDKATSYTLEYATDNSFAAAGQIIITDGATATEVMTGLMPDTQYYVRMKAWVNDYSTAYSNVLSASTLALAMPKLAAASDVETDGFTANWQAVDYSPTEGYVLVYNKDGESAQELNVGNVTSYVLSGLEQSSTYHYTVKGIHNGYQSAAQSPAVSVNTATVLAPTLASAFQSTYASLKVNWTKDAGNNGKETGFLLKYGQMADLSDGLVLNLPGTATEWTIDNLDQNKTYYFSVASVINGQSSVYPPAVSGTTQQLAAPNGLSLGAETVDQFTASWFNMTEADEGYELWISESSAFTSTLKFDLSAGQTTQLVSGLEQSTKYFAKIRAKAAGIVSDFSTTVEITTKTLGTPGTPTITGIDFDQATVSWTAATEANAYELQWTDVDASFSSYASLPLGDVLTANISGLNAGTSYWLRVVARYNAEESVSANNSFSTLTLAAPTIALNNATTNSLDVSWSAITEATEYYVEWAKDNAFATGKGSTVTSGTSFTISGLEDYTTYFVRVLSSRGGGVLSVFSNVESLPTSQLAAPTNLSVVTDIDNGGLRELTLSWDAVPGAVKYILRRYSDSGVLLESVEVSANNYTFSPLNGGTSYKFRVSVVIAQESLLSPELNYTTLTT